MENKKMSLAELKAKANAVTTAEALNAIKGGTAVVCHDGSCIGKDINVAQPDKTKVGA